MIKVCNLHSLFKHKNKYKNSSTLNYVKLTFNSNFINSNFALMYWNSAIKFKLPLSANYSFERQQEFSVNPMRVAER